MPKPRAHFLHIGKTGGSAINAALAPLSEAGTFEIVLDPHAVSLRDVPVGERFFFVLRDPVERFVSSFNDRLRQSRPRYDVPWTPEEERAYRRFPTPDSLARALSAGEEHVRRAAEQAMSSIYHVRHSYWHWFADPAYFEGRLEDLLYVLWLPSLESSFRRLCELLGLPECKLPADEVGAHRNPPTAARQLSLEAVEALERWYAPDFEFVQICGRLERAAPELRQYVHSTRAGARVSAAGEDQPADRPPLEGPPPQLPPAAGESPSHGDAPPRPMLVDIFEDRLWQMTHGERAAIEGVLSRLAPGLAIELGTAEGASLRRIAAHAREVHSFDLRAPGLTLPDNVTLHTGDSHRLLPEFLSELAEAGRNLDFVLVDGDHSAEGVRQDLEDLLDSPAVQRTVMLLHDTANEIVRAGLDAVRFSAWPKVCYVDLDWVPGRLFAAAELRNELWSGLGLVLVDAAAGPALGAEVFEQRYRPAAELLAGMRELLLAAERLPLGAQRAGDELWLRRRVSELGSELAAERARATRERNELALLRGEVERLQREHAAAKRAIENITGSLSWKVTRPLRGTKRAFRARD